VIEGRGRYLARNLRVNTELPGHCHCVTTTTKHPGRLMLETAAVVWRENETVSVGDAVSRCRYAMLRPDAVQYSNALPMRRAKSIAQRQQCLGWSLEEGDCRCHEDAQPRSNSFDAGVQRACVASHRKALETAAAHVRARAHGQSSGRRCASHTQIHLCTRTRQIHYAFRRNTSNHPATGKLSIVVAACQRDLNDVCSILARRHRGAHAEYFVQVSQAAIGKEGRASPRW
jgi:hypothetical protein